MTPASQKYFHSAYEAADWLDRLTEKPGGRSTGIRTMAQGFPRRMSKRFLEMMTLDRVLDDLVPKLDTDIALLLTEKPIEIAPLRANVEPSRSWPNYQQFDASTKRSAASDDRSRRGRALRSLRLLSWWWWSASDLRGVHTYSTGVGEERHLVLSDGSKVELGARSRLQLKFNDSARDIDLEGRSDVHCSPTTHHGPFRVHSGNVVVQAIGTRFNVDKRAVRNGHFP